MKILIYLILVLLTLPLLNINNGIFLNIIFGVSVDEDLISIKNKDPDKITLQSLFGNYYGNYESEDKPVVSDDDFSRNYDDSNSRTFEDVFNDYDDRDSPTLEDHKLRSFDSQTTNKQDKFVIIMFDRGYESIFSIGKPILDNFGFKASIFIACDYIEEGKGMNWYHVRELYLDGYDIQSHGSEHKRLTDLKSQNEIESIVSGGKECLEERGFAPTVFQAPYNKGGDDPIIIDTIGSHFDLAFTGHSELMFLNCDGWENFGYDKKNYFGTTDCSTYFSDGTPTPTNKLAMKEWSHDREHDRINENFKGDHHGPEISQALFDKFIQVVNDQSYFNKDGEINAIPIIGYHKISIDDSTSTSPNLFEQEMEYLYENGFKVITISDLKYNDDNESFYIKNTNQQESFPT